MPANITCVRALVGQVYVDVFALDFVSCVTDPCWWARLEIAGYTTFKCLLEVRFNLRLQLSNSSLCPETCIRAAGASAFTRV